MHRNGPLPQVDSRREIGRGQNSKKCELSQGGPSLSHPKTNVDVRRRCSNLARVIPSPSRRDDDELEGKRLPNKIVADAKQVQKDIGWGGRFRMLGDKKK